MPIASALRSALQSVFLALAVLLSPALFASVADGFDPNVDGNVFALARQPDGRILIGGAFSTLQPNGATSAISRKNIARVLPDGSNDASFSAETDGQVSAMVLQPDGRIVIVGKFTTVNGVARNHAARLEANGTLDPSFDPNTGGSLTPEVYTVLLQPDGKIVIGGGFTTVQPNGAAATTARSRVARFNADGSFDAGWVPNLGGQAISFNNLVLSLGLQPDGRLIVGGGFTKLTPNGGTATTRGRIARFNVDGSLDQAYDPNFNNAINAIIVQPDGKAIVGGSFTSMQPNGATETTQVLRLKRLNVDGTLDSSWFGEASGPVNTLEMMNDGYLLVGGSFASSGNAISAYAARLRPTGYSDTAVYGVNFNVYAFAPQPDGWVVMGGGFTAVRGAGAASLPRGHVARLSLRGGLDADFHPDVNGRVRTVAVTGSQVLVGGTFTSVGGLTRNAIVRLGAGGAVDPAFAANVAGTVYTAIDVADGKILLGGNFTRVNGAVQTNIARINADGSTDASFQIQASNTVTNFVRQPDGKILLIGAFTQMLHSLTSDPITRTYIARLNADGTIDTDFTPRFDAQVTSVAVQGDGKILAGGNFTVVLGKGAQTSVSRFGLVRLNSDGTVDPDFTPGVNGQVRRIVVQGDGKIIIAGSFGLVGGAGDTTATARQNIARLNANGAVDTTYDPNVNGPITATLLQSDGKLMIGGTFTRIGSGDNAVERDFVARLNADGTVDASLNLNLDTAAGNEVVEFAPMDDKVLVAGAFNVVSPSTGPTAVRHRLVRINADGTVDPSFNADVNAATGASIETLAMRASGAVYLGGSFSNIGGTVATNLARFNSDGAPDSNFAPSFNGPVHAISELPGKGAAVPTQRSGFAWIESNGQLHSGFALPTAVTVNSLTSVVVQPDGKLLLGGNFALAGEQTDTGLEIDYGVIRVNPDGTLDSGFQLVATADRQTAVQTVVLQPDGKILVGGTFSITTDSVTRSNLIRFNANGTVDSTFQQNIGSAVYTIVVQSDNKIVFGGDFTYLQTKPGATDTVARSHIARVTTDGTVDTTFTVGADNTVSRIFALPDGKLLISGPFISVIPNGTTTATTRPYAAVLNSDGTLGTTDFQLNQQILALVRQADGKLVVGGYFTSILGKAIPYVARLNADFTLDENFFPNPSGGVATVQLAADGKVLIGGNFASVQPNVAGYDVTVAIPRNGAARLNTDGSVDTTFNPNFGGAVNRLEPYSDGSILALGAFTNIQPNGSLLVGGSFSYMNGVAVSNLALLGDDGSVSSSFLPNPNGPVYALLPTNNGELIVAGAFTSIDGSARSRLARYNTSNLLEAGFAPAVNGDVYAVALQSDGKIVIGGSFTAIGATNQAHLARLNADGSVDTSFAPNVSGTVRVLALQGDGRVLFARETGASTSVLERVKSDGSADSTFNPANNGAISAIVAQADGRIVVGGSFTSIAGTSRSYLAGLNANGTLDPTVTSQPSAPVTALLVQSDGKILFTGQFNAVDGLPRYSIARTTTSLPVVQSFTVDASGSTVTWLRTVGGPEVYSVTFYGSTDGDNFTPLGQATRVPGTGNWRLSGLSIPANTNYYLGARAIGTTGPGTSTELAESAWWFYRGSAAAAPEITSATVVGGSTASSFFYAIGANGQPTGYWASGLPAGLSLDTASGLITGTPTQTGTFNVTLTATNAAGSTSVPVVFVIGSTGSDATTWHLLNISCRATVTNDHPLILGFAINGNAAKGVLLRGVGPTLLTQNVPDALARPRIVLNNLGGQPLLENAKWGDTQSLRDLFVRVGEFPLQSGSYDAAVATTLSPGTYTMVASDAGNTTAGGTVLAELYDTGDGAQQFAAMSARGYINGSSLLIGGFVIDGTAPRKVLIRGVGPVLAKSGVTDPVVNPTVKVYNANNQVVAENDDWSTPVSGGAAPAELAAAAAAVGDSPLDAGSKDSAVLVTLPPGIYTAQVGSADGSAGTALVEIYEVP